MCTNQWSVGGMDLCIAFWFVPVCTVWQLNHFQNSFPGQRGYSLATNNAHWIHKAWAITFAVCDVVAIPCPYQTRPVISRIFTSFPPFSNLMVR